MSRLKIGLVGVYRPLFKGDSLGIFTASAKALERLARSLDFELHAAGKPASNLQEAETVAR